MKAAVVFASTILAASAVHGAQEPVMHAGTLAHELDRLTNTGRVLYIAAHPDDENTRLLAYLANARHLTTAYLSMTRGGGGQNLIGSEQSELLDVIRTQELLAARRLDAAEQWFTRMRDFGYSKDPQETLNRWGKEDALADVVWVIRSFQPDVIITRFDEKPPNHGHHTASAILAREAFAAAANERRFPEQLQAGVTTWRTERVVLNVPTWRREPPPEDSIALDVGAFDPRLGFGYGELAALSRSQHKSQGFGRAGERGEILEHFVTVTGRQPTGDILAGIALGWERFGKPAQPLIDSLAVARAALDRDHPERAVQPLLQALAAFDALPDVPRVRDARQRTKRLIVAASGLFLRATAATAKAVPGADIEITLEAVLRRPIKLQLQRVQFPHQAATEPRAPLEPNRQELITANVAIPDSAPVTTPYWLREPYLAGRQQVTDQTRVGKPEGPPALSVDVTLEADGQTLQVEVPVVYAWSDRVHGERVRAFIIAPPVTVSPTRRAVVVANGAPSEVTLRLRSAAPDIAATIDLQLPEGWRQEPPESTVTFARAGEERTVTLTVVPGPNAEAVEVEPAVHIDGRSWAYREDDIDYTHIPAQTVLQSSRLRLVPATIALPSGRVGYIPGSGDSVATDLAHIGVAVDELDETTIRSGDLSNYAAILVGIRAYNTSKVVRGAHDRLMQYVEDGGVVVTQYNTNSRWSPLEANVGPYPLTIGRGRVTDETAYMEPVDTRHPLLNAPNVITGADFAGWVQERGLYFGETWDHRYSVLFSAGDPGEEPLTGSVLIARHGEGRFIYTGLSFFRQLPEGVPGAYRLLANFLSPDQP